MIQEEMFPELTYDELEEILYYSVLYSGSQESY